MVSLWSNQILMPEEPMIPAPPIRRKQKKVKRRPRRDDELWKGILEDVFKDFLAFFYPDADQLFNLKRKFEFLDKEFNRLFPPEEHAAGVRYVDKLVKVQLKAGGSKFILVHVEIQGQKGREDLSSRMFRYFYRAKDKHNVSVTAFAILIDDVKSYRPGPYIEEYLGTKLSYEFNTYKILDQEEAALRANPNPFAVVALVVLLALKNKTFNDDQLLHMKLDLTRELMRRNVSRSKRIKIMDFLTYYVHFEKREMMIKFEKEVEQLTGRTTTMGVREILMERWKNEGLEKGRELGLEQGLEQGKHINSLQIALAMKKDNFPIDQISKFTKLSAEEIEAL